MSYAKRMLETMPATSAFEKDALVACIEACFDCAQTCTACADACLEEEAAAELKRCIRLDLNCADICDATGRTLSRQTGQDARAVLEACAEACRACGDECERHARDMNMDHCRVCAEACRRCEQACRELVGGVA